MHCCAYTQERLAIISKDRMRECSKLCRKRLLRLQRHNSETHAELDDFYVNMHEGTMREASVISRYLANKKLPREKESADEKSRSRSRGKKRSKRNKSTESSCSSTEGQRKCQKRCGRKDALRKKKAKGAEEQHERKARDENDEGEEDNSVDGSTESSPSELEDFISLSLLLSL